MRVSLRDAIFPRFEIFLKWLAKHFLVIIFGVTFFIVTFEIFELISKNEKLSDPFHLIEITIYVVLLMLIGYLLRYLSNIITRHFDFIRKDSSA